MKTRDLARGRWHGILQTFGIDPKYLRNVHGPCPLCGGNDRWRFDNKDNNGTYFCSQCGPGDGFKLLEEYTARPFNELAKEIDQMCGTIEQREEPAYDSSKAAARLKKIGGELVQVKAGDPVSLYLRNRGISFLSSSFLRLHPGLPYYEQAERIGTFPAMVAAFRDEHGRIETFHVTYLTPEGEKAPVASAKKIMGKQRGLAGGSIRLSPVRPHIAICEGIETALSITELYGIPCWACYSAHALSEFLPPEGVEKVTIFADADRNYVGQAAATSCAKRLIHKGFSAEVAEFLPYGVDYNDILQGRKNAA